MDEDEDCDVESFRECEERVEEAEPGICGQSWSNAGSPPLLMMTGVRVLQNIKKTSRADSHCKHHRRYIF